MSQDFTACTTGLEEEISELQKLKEFFWQTNQMDLYERAKKLLDYKWGVLLG